MTKAALRTVACAALAASLTGCWGGEPEAAGTNGVSKLPPDRIHSRAIRAAEGAGSVRLAGRVVTDDGSVKLDMRLTGRGGMGQVTAGGGTFELLRVDKELFLRANDDFWLKQGDTEGEEPAKADIQAAQKLDGKYVKVPEDDSAYQQFHGFTDMDVLLDVVLGLKGKMETGDRGEVEGTPTIRLTVDGGKGGRLDVSLEGSPFPLRVERAGGAGQLKLVDWDEKFEVHVPREEDVVDYGKKISTGSSED